MGWICINGEFKNAEEAILVSSNRSFKWGDGLFETMKVLNGKILLRSLHDDRLLLGLRMLMMDNSEFSFIEIEKRIHELCDRNHCTDLARVRLAIFRQADNLPGYVIEARPLDTEVNKWNENGFVIDIYPLARKNMDGFSNLKSANFLPYVMAALYADENGLDDAIVLNHNNLICDSSKANIFLVKGNEVHTPALHQGCVNGVMRRFIIDHLHQQKYVVHQEMVTEQKLLDADEVFLTNAIYGIRWVQSFRNKHYSCEFTRSLHKNIMTGLLESLQ